MLALSEISVWFTGKALFDEASFLINKNDRIGLVGKNGAGKSTLLKIIAGLQEPEGGGIFKPNDITIGYLPQEMEHQDGRTVFDEALQAFKPLLELDAKIHVMGDEVAKGENVHSDAYMKLLDDLHEANDRFSMMGGYTMESDTEKILLGLGFNREDFPRITDTFSGGWRMRIELAKILLQKPDLLLLDEPTNHLDIESIQWLEGFLKDYPGAIVLVSHDRVFLDVITTRTIEINLGKFHDYNAPYSRYVEMRVERRTLQMASFENQQKMIEDTEKFIERFRYKASKAVQVQSRIKQLNKVDRIEIEEEDLSSIKFRFPDAPRSGKVVVATSHLTKIYPPKTILEDLEFEIERGDKVAFVGKNGEGKSTLSRIIAGIETYNGTLEFGHNTKIGFYAQNQAETLTGDKTVFQTIDDEAAGEMRTKVRSLLGAFLFGGDAIDKKVKVLSGGEKSRLSLAKLLLTPVNLLILDEPTNHLDMRSKEVLKEALKNYDGAMIVVSHDRDFLQGLTNKVFEFKNKKIKPFIGDVYDYLKARDIDTLAALEAVEKKKPQPEKVNYSDKKNLDREIKKIENQIQASEKKIAEAEKKIAEAESKLSNPAHLKEQPTLLSQYESMKKTLEEEMERWAQLHSELEGVK